MKFYVIKLGFPRVGNYSKPRVVKRGGSGETL